MTRLIAIASGKGGVGKTTTTVNLGAALAGFNKNVIIVDANLTTPDIGTHLGIHAPLTTLNDVFEGKASITDAIHLHPSGLRVVPAGLHLRHLKSANADKLWDVALDLFGSAEIVLLDTPAGLERGAKAVLEVGEEVLIVTNPEPTAVINALKTARVARKSGAAVLGVVINKVRDEKGEMKKEEIEQTLELPILAVIPHDDLVRHAVRFKKPVVLHAPHSPASRAFKKLAADLVGVEYELAAEGSTVVRVLKRIFGVE